MRRLLILVAVLFAVALGLHRLKTTSGELVLTIGDTAYAVDLTIAVVALAALVAAAIVLTLILRALFKAPHRFARGWRKRSARRGRSAIADGLIAIAAGDLRTAERATEEARRRSPDLPLVRLLEAQTAQLKGDRAAARRVFQAMTEEPRTRIAGLRGLYLEAEREGEREAARQIAERAREESATAPWAVRALLRHQTADEDWRGALKTLAAAADHRIVDRATARRQRAVILAAEALALEDGEPDRARHAALEAHELAPDLVAASVAAGRLLSRHGDIRRAIRVLEEAWKAGPHPEIADAYLHVRAGDSATDRLKRAETLFRLRPEADEGRLAVARAAIEAREFARARGMLTPVLTARPTQRALALMAELEEAETGDRGRAREWLARSVRAPRDPVWTADGVVLPAWAPVSPVTGRLDAVEWKAPVAELAPPALQIDAADMEPPPAKEPEFAIPASSAVSPPAGPTLPAATAAAPPAAPADALQAAPVPAPGGAAAPRTEPAPTTHPIAATMAGSPAPARGNGTLSALPGSDAIPPPHGAPPPHPRPMPRFDPNHPPIPDDPGVPDDEQPQAVRRLLAS